jgi:aminopeptidase YwaD
MKRIWIGLAAGLLLGGGLEAQKPPLLPEKDVAALANELSGETAKRNLEAITLHHRQRGSKGFHAAAELVAQRLREYGLSDVAILQFPADGKIFYGTQRSRPAWDAEFGELWEIVPHFDGCPGTGEQKRPESERRKESSGLASVADCLGEEKVKEIGNYSAAPVTLAEDSESANVAQELVDVGAGTVESDYAGKEVSRKFVLVSAQPGAVQDLAVGKFGAVGIVSYAQNQKTAWWEENESLIRWGHLAAFSPHKTFGFMVSLKTARVLSERLTRGERIFLRAIVKAGQHPGNYEVVTATISGADPKLKEEEIAFSCHLDHQRPGANDNASGCVTILEVARTLNKLISEGKLARPARRIRFIWPPEIEGTLALLNGKPEFAKRIKAVVHMDMVGGGPETKAVLHVTSGPMSLPSFVHDVAWAFAEWVNQESYQFAATGKAEYPLAAPEGGKDPLRAEYSAYTMGSDHDVYQDSSFGIPAIYLNDWPDRYIHTSMDTPANIDPTKLKRAGFIGAASGYFLANLTSASMPFDRTPPLVALLSEHRPSNYGGLLHKCQSLAPADCELIKRPFLSQEIGKVDSIQWFAKVPPNLRQVEYEHIQALEMSFLKPHGIHAEGLAGDSGIIWERMGKARGPLAVFGYDYFEDHAKAAEMTTPKLLSYEGMWGGGEEYAYEVLNMASGKKTALEIRDAVSAEYGPVPLELVLEYLKALGKIGEVVRVN